MNESLIEWIVFGGPMLLAAMGAYITIKPPAQPNKIAAMIWILAFVIVAGLTSWFSIYQSRDLERKLTGGDGYFFFQAEPLQPGATVHSLLVVNPGKYQLYDGAIEIFKIVGERQFQRMGFFELRVIRATSARTTLSLAPGRYKFEITARNGYWEEYLSLGRSSSATLQDAKVVRRDGSLLYQHVGVLGDTN